MPGLSNNPSGFLCDESQEILLSWETEDSASQQLDITFGADIFHDCLQLQMVHVPVKLLLGHNVPPLLRFTIRGGAAYIFISAKLQEPGYSESWYSFDEYCN